MASGYVKDLRVLLLWKRRELDKLRHRLATGEAEAQKYEEELRQAEAQDGGFTFTDAAAKKA